MFSSKPILLCLVAGFCFVVCFNPPAPLWPKKFIAGGITSLDFPGVTKKQFGGLQYYDWTREAMWSVISDPYGNSQGILNVNNTVWVVDAMNQNCCIDPTQTGVSPPRPDWLQQNSTYLGEEVFNDLLCEGWSRTEGDISFEWWISTASGTPKRLRNFGFVNDYSYFTTNDTLWPAEDVFAVPSYCPSIITNPNCSVEAIFF
eukprot:TRINITY_DN1187_c0_g1_i3.p1 TRINITY_DN1187_c0_g1~~TRINITY_DN1187_c0_g1_i3.p1  ORF type:complete len:202 (+),score=43.21 TRINITY_DN1187_c0_g1_i3:84-689(+)